MQRLREVEEHAQSKEAGKWQAGILLRMTLDCHRDSLLWYLPHYDPSQGPWGVQEGRPEGRMFGCRRAKVCSEHLLYDSTFC